MFLTGRGCPRRAGRGPEREVDFKAGDAPGRLARHNLGYVEGAAGQVNTVAPGNNRHRRDDARTEGVGY